MSRRGIHRQSAFLGLAGAIAALSLAVPAHAAAQDRPRAQSSSREAAAPAPVALSSAAAVRRPALEPGVPVEVRLRRGQKAFFRVPSAAGTAWSVRTTDLASGTDTTLDLMAADERILATDDDGGGDLASRVDFDSFDGAAILRAGTLADEGGRFRVLLTRTGTAVPPDIADTLDEARARPPLGAGQRTEVRLPPGRSALFALPEGKELVVETTDLKGATDTVAELLDSSGAVLAENDDARGDLASRLRTRGLKAPAAFVRVRELEGRSGRFALTVRELPPGNPAGLLATSVGEAAARPAIVPGQTVRLTLQEGEQAYFALPDDGVSYAAMTFDLAQPAAPGGDGMVDTVLALVDAEGRVLEENDDADGGGLASRLAVPPGRPAFLRVNLLEGSEGSFSLVLVRAP